MTGISTATFDGAPLGTNLAVPPHEIPDTQARFIQDAFVDRPGLIVQRGALATGMGTSFSQKSTGIVQVYRPDNAFRVGILQNDATTNQPTSLWPIIPPSWTLGSQQTITSGTASAGSPTYIFDAKPALDGGVIIGTAPQVSGSSNFAANQGWCLWHGAGKTTISSGTATCTVTSPIVTGSSTTWTSQIEPGMFVWISNTYVGVVQSVDSDTQLTLTAPAKWSFSGASLRIQSIRGFIPKYSSGRITTTTSSAAVTGAETHFQANITPTPANWRLLKASTGEFIGTVSTVNSDTSITLAANAAVALDNEKFIALQGSTLGQSPFNREGGKNPVGFLNSTYQSRQWYANCDVTPDRASRVWFSETTDFESVDFDPNVGNFLDVASTTGTNAPISAIASTAEALLILKEQEAFVLRGDTPEQFVLDRLPLNDGTLSTMSVQQVKDGIVFAGRYGVYQFDGTGITNIVANSLGQFYRDMVSAFNPSTSRMWSMVADDHYFLFIESATMGYVPIKGATPETPTRITLAIHLPTGAVTFHTNLDIRGSTPMPVTYQQGTWFVVNVVGANFNICTTNSIRSTAGGRDTITSLSQTQGPDFYVETKRYDLGDALRKKLFKEVLLTYLSTGSTLSVDTVPGLNEVGTTSGSAFPITSTFLTNRIKFLKRNQLLGFRIYPTTSTSTNTKLGPWALGYKVQRAGRP